MSAIEEKNRDKNKTQPIVSYCEKMAEFNVANKAMHNLKRFGQITNNHLFHLFLDATGIFF